MHTGLKDRVVIVAASSHGIGQACAEMFAAEGAKLAICSRDRAAIDAAAEQLRKKHGVDVLAEALDVTDEAQVRAFVSKVTEHYGRVDVCVTNAGGPPAKMFMAVTTDEWHRAFELNFMSAVYFMREVIPHMQRNKFGRIITITSVSVKQPIPDLVLSNSIRTGLTGLVRSLANEFGRDGITVNNVGPGFTATQRLHDLAAVRAKAAGTSEEETFAKWGEATATGRVAQPEEVASAVVWLASEGAAMVTGQTVLVDGGSYKGL